MRCDCKRLAGPGLFFAAAILATIDSAHAYVGPGLGLGTLGVVVGIIGSVLLAIFAVVWYPLKRVLKKRRQPAKADAPAAEE